jgi:2-methylcitrate dehydratase PrpD
MATIDTTPSAQDVRGEASGVTAALARFIATLNSGDVPAATREVLAKAVVDGVGCGLHGLTLPWSQALRGFALEQGGPAQASVWLAGGQRVSAGNAALAMGASIHAFDFDDHHNAKIHATAAVLPAALALGEHLHIDGPTLLRALAAGYETMIRVSLAANPGAARMRGWHLTGTCGTFGAAAAASVILGFDAATTASALGLAGTQSAGLWAFNADGAMSKRLHPGRSAQAGVTAALLAARGFEGPRFILEAEDGGFLAAMSDESQPAEIVRELGEVWRIDRLCFKRHSCCGSNHSCIDAALLAMAESGLGVDEIERIELGISRVVERQTGFAYSPGSVLNAQMSIRYDVAVAMLDGEAVLAQFTPERLHDPRIANLIERIEVKVDPEMDAVYPRLYAGIVTLVGRDGRRVTRRVDHPKGMPENPISMAEIERKFRSLGAAALSGAGTEAALAAVSRLFEATDIAPACAMLGTLASLA